VGSWIPSLAVPTTNFGGGQHSGDEEEEEEEEKEGSKPMPEEVKCEIMLLWKSAEVWFLALLLLVTLFLFPRHLFDVGCPGEDIPLGA